MLAGVDSQGDVSQCRMVFAQHGDVTKGEERGLAGTLCLLRSLVRKGRKQKGGENQWFSPPGVVGCCNIPSAAKQACPARQVCYVTRVIVPQW